MGLSLGEAGNVSPNPANAPFKSDSLHLSARDKKLALPEPPGPRRLRRIMGRIFPTTPCPSANEAPPLAAAPLVAAGAASPSGFGAWTSDFSPPSCGAVADS